MTALNKKDIKNAGFLFGKYDAITTTGSAATLALAPSGQDNVWEHLGIPLSFEETNSADSIDRRVMSGEEMTQLEIINKNMISVSFEFNIPKVKGGASDTGFDLTRWLHGKALKTSYGFGKAGATFTDSDDGNSFSLRVYDGVNQMVYRDGRLTSISVTFDDGLYSVSGDAMFISENKTVNTTNIEQMDPLIDNSGQSDALLQGIGPVFKKPLTNLDSNRLSIKNGSSALVPTTIRSMSISKSFNIESVKALGSEGVLDLVKTSNGLVSGSFELEDISDFTDTGGIVAALKTAYGSEEAKAQFEFFKGGSSTIKNRGFLILPTLVLSERKDSYSESDFATRNYSFSSIVANIADEALT